MDENILDELNEFRDKVLYHPDTWNATDRHWNRRMLKMKEAAENIFIRSKSYFEEIIKLTAVNQNRDLNSLEVESICLRAISLMDSLIELRSRDEEESNKPISNSKRECECGLEIKRGGDLCSSCLRDSFF